MSAAEWVALIGIFATFTVALASLAWNIIVYRQDHRSPAAERLEEPRRQAIVAFRSQLGGLRKSLIHIVNATHKHYKDGNYREGVMTPLGEFSASNTFQIPALQAELAVHLHTEEAEQLDDLCRQFTGAVSVLNHRYRPDADHVHEDVQRAMDASVEIERWTLHLISPPSIDLFLKGKSVRYTNGEEKK